MALKSTQFLPITLVALLLVVGSTLGCPSDWPVEDDDSVGDDDISDDDSAGDDDSADDDSAADADADSGSGR